MYSMQMAVNAIALCFIVSGGTSLCPTGAVAVAQERIQTNAGSSRPCGPPPRIGITPDNATSNPPQEENQPTEFIPCPAPQSPGPSPTSRVQVVPGTFFANDRVEIETPAKDLVLTEENEISLAIHSPGLLKVFTYQKDETAEPVIGGAAEPPVLHHQDGSAYISVVPMRVGEVTLSISGKFSDGGYFNKEVSVNVRPPERDPSKFAVSDSPVIHMHLAGHDRNMLYVDAWYDGFNSPFWIKAPFVRYTMRTNSNVPVINLDETTGVITPLNVGEVLVTTRFGDKEYLNCVIVTQNISSYYDPAACKKLLRPGEQLESLISRWK